jgi:hypothetical protein
MCVQRLFIKGDSAALRALVKFLGSVAAVDFNQRSAGVWVIQKQRRYFE